MEGEELRIGKDRVAQYLIEPLERMGLTRKRSVTVADHSAFRESLCARLAYMTRPNLQALADVVERHAGGPTRNHWPAEVSICNWARRLQEPPASDSRLVRSYLQSAAGDAADSGRYLVELMWRLKQFGLPITSFAMTEIQKDARDNARRLQQIIRDQAAGCASLTDMNWMTQYHAALTRCREIRAKKNQEADAA